MYVEVRDCSNDMRSLPPLHFPISASTMPYIFESITIKFELIQTNLFVLSALRFHNFYLPTSGL